MGHRLLASLALVPLALPLTAMASPSMAVAASAQRPQLSTGVIPARVIHDDGIRLPDYVTLSQMSMKSRTVKLTLEVDRKGYPRDIQIHSPDGLLDWPVRKAVNDFRFRPAQLDNHSVVSTVNLIVRVHS